MFSWLAKQMIGRQMRALRAGDVEPGLALDAEEVQFRFPGDSSFAPGANGKDELREWLGRFVAIGLQIYPDEVILKGFPWRQTICVRGHIHLDDPGKGRVYDNRYVIWGRIAWGKLREYEVYEDTEETRRLDQHLAATGGG
ncbi:MAG TPA: nuclear transport factor 2 family protein [Solirubrobacterales bacterium]|nr:nuclear transport factor 2 family protein [Solirubrobacterales bacterium]